MHIANEIDNVLHETKELSTSNIYIYIYMYIYIYILYLYYIYLYILYIYIYIYMSMFIKKASSVTFQNLLKIDRYNSIRSSAVHRNCWIIAKYHFENVSIT